MKIPNLFFQSVFHGSCHIRVLLKVANKNLATKNGPFLDPHFLDPGKSHNLGVPDVPTVHKNPLVGAFGCFEGLKILAYPTLPNTKREEV